MRPVRRESSPQNTDFDPYDTARPFLISRLGSYCSYCERRIVTQLAVEHIQPKSLPAYAPLVGRWNNYLLSCVNCNSTKKDKDVVLADILLPDRDNTFLAFAYSKDGKVVTSLAATNAGIKKKADDTLSLTGLDKSISSVVDENGKQVAIDRMSQRMEVWAVALDAKLDLAINPGNTAAEKYVIKTALGYGHFSIWMTVFTADPNICNQLIDAFAGTRDSGCFNSVTATPVSPAPNLDMLADGGKI